MLVHYVAIYLNIQKSNNIMLRISVLQNKRGILQSKSYVFLRVYKIQKMLCKTSSLQKLLYIITMYIKQYIYPNYVSVQTKTNNSSEIICYHIVKLSSEQECLEIGYGRFIHRIIQLFYCMLL